MNIHVNAELKYVNIIKNKLYIYFIYNIVGIKTCMHLAMLTNIYKNYFEGEKKTVTCT